MGMLNSSHPLIAMATLMYSNINLQEVRECCADLKLIICVRRWMCPVRDRTGMLIALLSKPPWLHTPNYKMPFSHCCLATM